MSDSLESTTLCLNVSCSLRDKKFLFLGGKDSTISEFMTSVQKMFTKLYPEEPSLDVSGVQNRDGFDIFADYKLGDIFQDNACVYIVESHSQGTKADESTTSSGFFNEQQEESDKKDLKIPVSSKGLNDTGQKQKESGEKKNSEKHEKIEKHLSPSENKRSHSDSTDADNEKRKKKYKNTKKKVVKQ